MTVPANNALGYPPNSQPSTQRVVQNRAPTANDYRNFREGAEWLDKSSNDWYKLADITGTTALWVRIGGSPGDLNSITTPDTTVVVPTAGNINFLNGLGMDITGSGSDITFNVTGQLFPWSVITSSPQALSTNAGYFANAGGGISFSLPATAEVGDIIFISLINAGGWTVTQGAGQTIHFGNQDTTTGAGGSLASTAIGDSLTLVCSVQNTDFVVINSVGNITVV